LNPALNKRAILLTGTIIPNSVFTEHNNPELRLREYLYAIKFYCNLFKNDDVYFLENSEYKLEENADYVRLRKEVNFTLIKGKKSEKFNEGKGYQEFEMVDRAVEMLKDNYPSFIKITGRYLISNAANITNFICKGLVIDLNRKADYAQTYLLYFTGAFYQEYLKGEYAKVNDLAGNFIERVVYKKIKENNLFGHCSLFKRTPLLSGTTGSSGRALKRNPLKVFIRDIERFFYNLLHIKTFFY